MPVYEYQCPSHGVFDAVRPMAEYAEPCACPECLAPAPRVLITPPGLGGANRSSYRAHETNARSADAPKKLSSHGPGCGCCGKGGKSGKKSTQTLHRPDGSKSFPAKRPWMISH